MSVLGYLKCFKLIVEDYMHDISSLHIITIFYDIAKIDLIKAKTQLKMQLKEKNQAAVSQVTFTLLMMCNSNLITLHQHTISTIKVTCLTTV